MSRFTASIYVKLSYSIGVFVMIIVGLAISSNLVLVLADRKSEAVTHKWLPATIMLGEMADRLTEFRLAESYIALAPDPEFARGG